ncbi:UspA domain protein [Desulfatibacillum aliphaticivorans]|uniref:UspA domain protein n=1 Tax=Desulfatibacillum aliphaticivorans TaxID=218208 RepID=B8FKL8_DESAL|nr:universal stress protein [Desulfatibacillum aliphaticivorans]ACL01833.1 UspA domain protein [Desulfatibacillum aliphaticivorans]
MNIKNILFPTDFSSTSVSALPWVYSLTEKYGAQVHFFHVVEKLGQSGFGYVPAPTLSSWKDQIFESAEKTFERFCHEQMDQCPNFIKAMKIGNPVEEIIAYANDNDIDLIVIPSRARKGMDRLLMGSVAEKLVRSSSVPVLVVNPG